MNATWVDGHVHFYPRFALPSLLDAARENLLKAGLRDGVGVLLMAQVSEDEHPLGLMQERIAECGQRWVCRTTEHADGLICYFDDNPSLVFIAGRQIVTCEQLELLSLCTSESIASGQSLIESIRQSRAADGVPVLPWGFGKWWFQRGQILRNLLSTTDMENGILLGDNGGRTALGGTPGLFRAAEARGIAVLAGSDPLNLPGHEARVCSYGSLLQEALDLEHPVKWMRERLSQLTKSPPRFGACRSVGGFLTDQVRLRLGR